MLRNESVMFQNENMKSSTQGSSNRVAAAISQSSSGRSSVISCASSDSGVSSRSDDEPSCLPVTPEKSTTPITIAVVSPASRGVIELVENGAEGFIGYFKPEILGPGAQMSRSSPPVVCCGGFKRSRVTRSVSTNVSEDSCDSAFQNNSRSCSDSDSIEGPGTPPTPEKQDRKRRKLSPDKLPQKRVQSSSAIIPATKRRYISTPRKSRINNRSQRNIKRSPGKTALRRIQHHNRSPERSAEEVVPLDAAKRGRTRSHLKSLLKDVESDGTSSPNSPCGSPYRHNHQRSNTRPFYETVKSARQRHNSNSKLSSPLQRKAESHLSPWRERMTSEHCTEQGSTSACHWR